jgi:ATP-binding cassette subfamily F protein 3
MIQLERVEKRFGARLLFTDLTWLVPRGARIGLVGANGAGKTTLLRLLAGLDSPDRGSVHAPGSLSVGFLPQEVDSVGKGSVLSTVMDGWPEIQRLEERMEALAGEMEALSPEDDRLPDATETYGRLRERFEQEGGDLLENRAKTILSGLQVPRRRFHEPLVSLSGGWRMRVLLARLLLRQPDLLLLDEPTNHLDLDALLWLEEFLARYDGTVVAVSHDRYFLNRVISNVVELQGGKLTAYSGGYDDFLEERQQRMERLEELAKAQEREIARVRRFVERFRYKASKARQVQSRLVALERIERVESPSRAKTVRFGFPPAPRSGDVVARLTGVAKRYGTIEVFRGADLLVRRGDRIALVGPNGAGKSTLLGLLLGRVPADGGTVEIGHGVRMRHFAQHHLDALRADATVLEEAETGVGPDVRPRVRTLLGSFLFSGDDVLKTVGILSGGEKARLALAKILLDPANLLLLDEPTNHLDLSSREVLEDALAEYDGTLLVVSHDRYFINRIATSVATIGDGGIEHIPGDYDAWMEWRQDRSGGTETADSARGEGKDREAERGRRRAEAEERNRRHRIRRAFEERLRPVEERIQSLERRLAEIDTEQGDPATYRDGKRARALGRERTELEERLRENWQEWEALAEQAPD